MTETTTPRARRMKDRIVTAAQEVFLASGYEAASMDAVAAVAGVSKQTVYAHFGSKEGLFEAMVLGMIGAAIAARDTRAPVPAPTDDLRDFLRRYGISQFETAANPRLMQLRRLAIAEAARFPKVGAQVWAAGPATSIERLATIFARLDAEGRIAAPDPARAASVFNWLLMGGPTSEAMLLGTPLATSDREVADHVDEAVRVFLAAYGVEDASR